MWGSLQRTPPHTQTDHEHLRGGSRRQPHSPPSPRPRRPSGRPAHSPCSEVPFGKVGLPHSSSDYSSAQHGGHLAGVFVRNGGPFNGIGYCERAWPTAPTRLYLLSSGLSRWRDNRRPGLTTPGEDIQAPTTFFLTLSNAPNVPVTYSMTPKLLLASPPDATGPVQCPPQCVHGDKREHLDTCKMPELGCALCHRARVRPSPAPL